MVGTTPLRLIRGGVLVILVAGCAQPVQPPSPLAVSPTVLSTDAPSPSDGPPAAGPVLVRDGSQPGSVGFWDAQRGLITGRDPRGQPSIALTSDGGRALTWIALDSDAPGDLSVFGSADAVYLSGCAVEPAVDCEPNLERTSDRGLSWTTVGGGAQLAGLRRISFAGGIGWGVALAQPADNNPNPNGAVLRRTLDGGKTWKTIADPCRGGWPTLEDVQFVDAWNGWIVCDAPGAGTMAPTALYVTTDAGKSFVVRSTSDFAGPRNLGRPPSGPVEAIEAADLTSAFVMQGRSGTARTEDGGVTWIGGPPGDPETVFVDSMSATADGTVFAIAQDGNVRQIILEISTDNGRTWEARAAWPMD